MATAEAKADDATFDGPQPATVAAVLEAAMLTLYGAFPLEV